MPPGAGAWSWSIRNASDVMRSDHPLPSKLLQLRFGQADLTVHPRVVRTQRLPGVSDPAGRGGEPGLHVCHGHLAQVVVGDPYDGAPRPVLGGPEDLGDKPPGAGGWARPSPPPAETPPGGQNGGEGAPSVGNGPQNNEGSMPWRAPPGASRQYRATITANAPRRAAVSSARATGGRT